MKINRPGTVVLGLTAAGTLLLTACGTDDNSTTPAAASGGDSAARSASTVAGITCPSGSADLTLAGSTAQANAVSVWTKNFENQCADVDINNGLGASDSSGSRRPGSANRTAFFNLRGAGLPGHLVEIDDTGKIFTNPSRTAIEDYVSGRFG